MSAPTPSSRCTIRCCSWLKTELAEEAFAGDITAFPITVSSASGDALTEGEVLHFKGIPSFAPELLQRVRPTDPMRAKHLGRALEQLAEEGAARIFKPRIGGNWIVGVVGSLQFDVLADRIKSEYEIRSCSKPRACTRRAGSSATTKR